MGQYWIPVNLKKREFVHPHKLGTGLKLWEQLANHPGTGEALVILTAAMPEPRGGGDLDLAENWHGPERVFPANNTSPGTMPEEYGAVAKRTIGRWAGDPIAIVGDYAERSDLRKSANADLIYDLCLSREELADLIAGYATSEYPGHKGKAARLRKLKLKPFTDITNDVVAVIEHELRGKFTGDGWREWVPNKVAKSAGV